LSELWGKGGSSFASQVGNEHTNIGLRLQEEKYRRQVCTELLSLLLLKIKSVFEKPGFYAETMKLNLTFQVS
jgi:hypothetical protein